MYTTSKSHFQNVINNLRLTEINTKQQINITEDIYIENLKIKAHSLNEQLRRLPRIDRRKKDLCDLKHFIDSELRRLKARRKYPKDFADFFIKTAKKILPRDIYESIRDEAYLNFQKDKETESSGD